MTLTLNPAELIIDTITTETAFPVQSINVEDVEISGMLSLSNRMASDAEHAADRNLQEISAQLSSEHIHDQASASADLATEESAFVASQATAEQSYQEAVGHNTIANAFAASHQELDAKSAAAEQAANTTRAVVEEEMRTSNAVIEERHLEASVQAPTTSLGV